MSWKTTAHCPPVALMMNPTALVLRKPAPQPAVLAIPKMMPEGEDGAEVSLGRAWPGAGSCETRGGDAQSTMCGWAELLQTAASAPAHQRGAAQRPACSPRSRPAGAEQEKPPVISSPMGPLHSLTTAPHKSQSGGAQSQGPSPAPPATPLRTWPKALQAIAAVKSHIAEPATRGGGERRSAAHPPLKVTLALPGDVRVPAACEASEAHVCGASGMECLTHSLMPGSREATERSRALGTQ